MLFYIITPTQKTFLFYFVHFSGNKFLAAAKQRNKRPWTFSTPFYQAMTNPEIHKNVNNLPL
jgi:hypothetical protein